MKRQHSRTWYAAVACIAFVIGTHVTDLMRLFHLDSRQQMG
jgi:hypothetical protein